MSTLSTRKIKHDSSSIDNITLDSSGNVGINKTTPRATTGFNSLSLNGTDGSEIWFDANNGAATRLSGTSNETRITAQASGSVITMFTGGTERLRIDNSGRVTTPNQPAFQVNHSLGNIGVGTILFNNVVINNGSCYSTSTGRFTAPCNGLYYFSTVLGFLSPTGNSCFIRKNGTTRVGLEIGANSSGWWNLTGSIIIDLATNDYVEVYFNNATSTYTTFDQGIWSNFSGYLIG